MVPHAPPPPSPPGLPRPSVSRGHASRLPPRISPGYHPFSPPPPLSPPPLPASRPPVPGAVLPLSGRISPRTRQPAYAPFKPSDSEQRSHGSSYRGCWHELSPCFLQG